LKNIKGEEVELRGRPGESRYRSRRQTIIQFDEFIELVESIETDNVLLRSLVVILYYLGIRIAEICGDGKRRWKKLTAYGKSLSRDEILPKNWRNTEEEDDLWYWKERGPLPGILKEDLSLEGNILRIYSKPLKHGKREGEGQLELDLRYPYVNLLVQQGKSVEPGEKVWDIPTWNAWKLISDLSEGRIYPHAFRLSRATVMARNPDMSIADLKQWFGWARGETADKYIIPIRSVAKARRALADEIPPELIKEIE